MQVLHIFKCFIDDLKENPEKTKYFFYIYIPLLDYFGLKIFLSNDDVNKINFSWLNKKSELLDNKKEFIKYFDEFLSIFGKNKVKILDLKLLKNRQILFLIEGKKDETID